MKVKLIDITENPIEKIYKAYRICYSKVPYDEVKIPKKTIVADGDFGGLSLEAVDTQKMIDFIVPLMEEQHTSPLEHVSFSFAIEGISRACLAQLTRHRTFKFNCVSGDTILYRGQNGKKKTTIKEFYEMSKQYQDMSVIRCLDIDTKELVTTKVTNVWQTGVKEVYKVTAKNGYTVKTTLDHRFLTPNGWKELKDLNVGEMVYTNGIEAYKDKEWLNKKYNEENLSQQEIAELCGVSKHTVRNWVRKFGLQKGFGEWSIGKEPPNKGKNKYNYEPMMRTSEKMKGNVGNPNHGDFKSIDEIKDMEKLHRARRVKKDVNYCEMCGVTGLDRYEVHHIDKNHNNYNENNLLKLCSKCHAIQHKGASVMVTQLMEITSIEYVGEEMVYDLEVEHKDHNFVGNGFILHNCQSQRYVDGKNFDFVMPDLSYIEDDIDRNVVIKYLKDYFDDAKNRYERLVAYGLKKEDARAILPQATTCNLVVTMDLNNFRNFLRQRLCVHAQKEIRELSQEMVKLLKPYIPFVDHKVLLCQRGLCNHCKVDK